MKQTIDRAKHNVLTIFENTTEYFYHAQHGETPLEIMYQASRRESGAGFSGTETWEEAYHLATHGWPEGRRLVEKLSAEIVERIVGAGLVQVTQYDVEGDDLDIGRYLLGEPEVWGYLEDTDTRVESFAKPKVIHLVLNLSASAAINKSTLIARGAAAAALVDILEMHNVRCEVTLTESVTPSTGSRRGHSEFHIPVKKPGDSLQMDQLAFLMAHPASLRRIVFAVNERLPEDIIKHFGFADGGFGVGGYGIPTQSNLKGDIHVGHIYSESEWSKESSIAWIKKVLIEQGFTLEGLG